MVAFHLSLLITGAKIHQSAGLTRFIEQGGRTYSVEEGTNIPEAMVPLYEHAQEGRRKCRTIEQTVSSLETEGSGGSYFPIVSGRRRKRRNHPSLSSSSVTTAAVHPTTSGTTPHDSSQGTSSRKAHSNEATLLHMASQSSLSGLCTTSPSTVQFPDHVTVRSIYPLTTHHSNPCFCPDGIVSRHPSRVPRVWGGVYQVESVRSKVCAQECASQQFL